MCCKVIYQYFIALLWAFDDFMRPFRDQAAAAICQNGPRMEGRDLLDAARPGCHAADMLAPNPHIDLQSSRSCESMLAFLILELCFTLMQFPAVPCNVPLEDRISLQAKSAVSARQCISLLAKGPCLVSAQPTFSQNPSLVNLCQLRRVS